MLLFTKGKIAKELRRLVYRDKSKRNQGSRMVSGQLCCDSLRSDYQEKKRLYKEKGD